VRSAGAVGATVVAAGRAAWIAGLLAALGGCAATAPPQVQEPRSYVVLLPGEDGRTGAVVVRSAQASVLLDRPMQGVEIKGAAIGPSSVTQEQLDRDFAIARSMRPARAEVFRLYFRTGEASLTPASEKLIGDILQSTRSRPAADVSIIGHTDTEGSASSNERLGLDRARWVAALLGGRGLTAVEVTIATHGERDLLVPTPDETAEARNRRVEVIVR
jgi:outer membrane protein OmpA-like peptidoglycan-associated protein